MRNLNGRLARLEAQTPGDEDQQIEALLKLLRGQPVTPAELALAESPPAGKCAAWIQGQAKCPAEDEPE